MVRMLLTALVVVSFACQQSKVAPPEPVYPVPSARQLAWHQLEFYAFIHFNMNTFTNMEWGFGDESPGRFDPTELDTRQWVRVVKEAGMKGIILTAKHHDGFCLWPSSYTEHSVKNSPWKDGKGDVLRELSDACEEYGLKFGVYLSPWDRNHPDYGTPEYVTYFRNQLRELLTNYGEVFEVWFDGANGGTGYYGGANEDRRVDKKSYYDWPNTFSIIRELQPNAVIFGDAGLDVRWVGNEHGFAYPTTWSNLLRDSVYAGMPEYSKQYSPGQENGTHWVPAEADVSIRPGWYYHPYEDHKVKSLPHLLDIYYKSIGQNASLLLNFPVDNRGLIHEKDVEQVMKLAAKVKEDFANDLAAGVRVNASNERGTGYKISNVVDGKAETYWATEDGVTAASIDLSFGEPTIVNRFLVQEYVALGQRVKAFTLEGRTDEGWVSIAEGTTIGYKRILRFPDIEVEALRMTIKDAKACPAIANIEIYKAPALIVPPVIVRDRLGMVTIEVPDDNVSIFYSIDGSDPMESGQKYAGPFEQHSPTVIQAIAKDEQSGKVSDVSTGDFDISKIKWSVVGNDDDAEKLIDGSDNTWWSSESNEVVIDLGEVIRITGFTYMPMQQRWISGFISEYQLFTSGDGIDWRLSSEGEFSNILNSPILQTINLNSATDTKFIKLRAIKTVDDRPASFAEISVLTR